ncbi:MAG: hypothetical protein JNL86_03525 [Nitrospira sp.]|nr:hypothetical protein [Nitrospira sp.]MBX3339508.1 hypothetical protein [Nitrospira sp.]MCC7470777.1 hypothetical protein [Candidatus Nomurabacteria bacterium]
MANEAPRRTCGTQNVHLRLMSSSQEYVANRARSNNHALEYARTRGAFQRPGVTVIPVVVHVVYNIPAQNISDAQINSQIEVLNKDFRKTNPDIASLPGVFAPLAADARIEFKLAEKDPANSPTNGITRTSTVSASFIDDDKVKSATTGGHDAWPSDKYLNLWVCPLGGGLLGYAQFPGGPTATDGVVINCTAFGTIGTAAAPFNLGRTATHEIGHFLNLNHIWGDDGSACSGTDFVGDTPNQAGPNYGTPAFPHVTCSNGPNGDLFMNYMDYVDDQAMFMFTAGQITRMQACLDGDRSTLGVKKLPTLKFVDDPTLKFREDITTKFADDPSLKFADDPTLKFREDITTKFADDPSLKFVDDPTLKFREDITTKFADDGGSGSIKVLDDPIGTVGGADPIGSGPLNPGGPVTGAGMRGGSTPFILSTPHHSMAWKGSFPEAYQAQLTNYEQQIEQLEQLLSQYQQSEQTGMLTDADRQQAEQIHQEYQRLVGEYSRMIQGN